MQYGEKRWANDFMNADDIWNSLSDFPAPDGLLSEGGMMGDAIRHHDWAATSLGPMATWPLSLKNALRMMLTSRQPMSLFWGRDLIMLYNDGYAPFLAERHGRALGQPFQTIWSDVWQELVPLVAETLSGRGTGGEDIRLMMLRDGVEVETFWTFSYTPVHDDHGRIAGLINITTETTSHVRSQAAAAAIIEDTQRQLEHTMQLERQRRIVQREMAHRIKNILSMTMAVVSQSMRHATSIEDAQETITHRIGALAKAQDILTDTEFRDANVRSIIEQVLKPHQDHSGRTRLDGRDVKVSAQQALGLSLAMHELATNAVKYGALSNENGTISVRWEEGADNTFRLEWQEAGGPPVVPPSRKGFGSRLTGRIVGGYFNGAGDIDYHPQGVRYVLTGTIERLADELNPS
ncbi:PAS domain-containing sensor histidine kinase [Ferranicluibacter rubi]